jgi:tetratricopeptide (TPR) repeat protein
MIVQAPFVVIGSIFQWRIELTVPYLNADIKKNRCPESECIGGENGMQCSMRSILKNLLPVVILLSVGAGFARNGFSQPAEEGNKPSAKMSVSAQDWAKKYPEVFNGVEKFKAKDESGALQDFEDAVGKYPELPPAELILADMYIEQNRTEMAINALDTAARKYPDDPETFLLLGNLAFQENRNTDASLSFDKARTLLESYDGDSMRLKRLQLRLYAGLATIATRFDDWPTAAAYLREWVNLDPQNSGARVRFARSLFRTNKGREAFGQLEYAKKIDNSILSPSMLMAQFWMEAGNMEAGREWLDRASRRQADDLNTQLMLARFHWNLRQFAAAKKSVLQAIKLSKNDPQANLLAGRLYHYDHDFDNAIQYFRSLNVDDVPEAIQANAKQHLMYALAAEGTPEGIAEAISLAEAGNDKASLVAECYAYKQSGKSEKALAILQAAQHSTQDPNTNYIFAYVLSDVKGSGVMPLLEAALATEGLFVFRRDAEQLKAKLSADNAKKNKKASSGKSK